MPCDGITRRLRKKMPFFRQRVRAKDGLTGEDAAFKNGGRWVIKLEKVKALPSAWGSCQRFLFTSASWRPRHRAWTTCGCHLALPSLARWGQHFSSLSLCCWQFPSVAVPFSGELEGGGFAKRPHCHSGCSTGIPGERRRTGLRRNCLRPERPNLAWRTLPDRLAELPVRQLISGLLDRSRASKIALWLSAAKAR